MKDTPPLVLDIGFYNRRERERKERKGRKKKNIQNPTTLIIQHDQTIPFHPFLTLKKLPRCDFLFKACNTSNTASIFDEGGRFLGTASLVAAGCEISRGRSGKESLNTYALHGGGSGIFGGCKRFFFSLPYPSPSGYAGTWP